MNTSVKNPIIKAVVEQVSNNATSWLGHHKFDNKDIECGQTFVAPSEGELQQLHLQAAAGAQSARVLEGFVTDPRLRRTVPAVQAQDAFLGRDLVGGVVCLLAGPLQARNVL